MSVQESVVGNLSQIIAEKQKELHRFHDMRCTQLESLLEERDRLLIESSKRFEQLKEDFQYNLTLIESRDREIDRLENTLEARIRSYEAVDAERKELAHQLEAAAVREQEQQRRAEQEKAGSKRVLDELREGIRAMQWAADEEARSRTREIENLRNDVKRISAQREEALEVQRRDLTQTFEQMMQQREEAFANKEKDIAQQVLLLESRFEKLLTENARLKGDAASMRRKVEQLTEEAAAREEAHKQLLWQLEDERKDRRRAEDEAERRYQQLAQEQQGQRDALAKEAKELQRKADRVRPINCSQRSCYSHATNCYVILFNTMLCVYIYMYVCAGIGKCSA